ncbi:hypothetical protein B1756_14965 [Natrarchaeobaculum aegyptiacum]|uniref:Alpha-galactosidase NEW3 domain-containing protein n=1 Tax=Natrarchaeobaculum aegyptiacum TaxID=745377 RepID=A0A2Z2I1T6_9EURY|nr:hypothetical protein B1756_14965 [Natrarchaeobaculum aegyptiacum]
MTRGEPEIDASIPDNRIAAGTEESVGIQVQNEGNLRLGTQSERVTGARGVTVEIVNEGPFEVRSGTSSIGSLGEGQMQEVSQRIAVPEDVDPGEYDVTIEVSYSYDYQVSDNSGVVYQRTGSDTIDLTIVVPDDPQFEISDVATDVEPGGDGTATLEIENVGADTATQTRVTITGGGGVTVDGEAAEEVLGDLEPGETATVSVDVEIAATASAGAKPLDLEFAYADGSGIQREEAVTETASLAPAPEQSFSISNVEDTLAVGYNGVVTGEVKNDGTRAVDDAVLVVEPMTDSLFVEDTRYALPPIEPGESTEFRYPVDVSGQADEGPRQVRFTIEYSAGDRSTVEDGPFSERVVIDPRTDEFSLADDGITVEQGGHSEFVIEITNRRDETLSNIDANLYADSPLNSQNDEAFVAELAPGESAKLQFDVFAAPDAPAETHPVELDFEYDTERGETQLSDAYQHPVEVTPSSDDGGIGVVGVIIRAMVVLTAIGIAGTLWWRLR